MSEESTSVSRSVTHTVTSTMCAANTLPGVSVKSLLTWEMRILTVNEYQNEKEENQNAWHPCMLMPKWKNCQVLQVINYPNETIMKQSINKALHVIGHVLCVCLKWVIQKMIRFDRKVWKRYFNLETPLYKLWWSNHARAMQKKLDKEHNLELKAA